MKYSLLFFTPILLIFFSCQKDPFLDPRSEYTLQRSCLARDYGVGVLFPEPYTHPDVFIIADSINFSDTLAVWSLGTDMNSGYLVSGANIVKQSLIEYAYEVSGLPILLAKNSTWTKVIYGYDSAGQMLSGWVKLTDNLKYHMWDEYLSDRAQFIATCEAPEFYDSPDGMEMKVELNYSYNDYRKEKRLDYIITPLKVDGRWMQIILDTPSPYCSYPEKESSSTTTWIKYLYEDGSPMVWFYTRGC